jgi:uncharacterized membrane protein YeiH
MLRCICKEIKQGHQTIILKFAVGGGVIRDILLTRIPVILKKEIYASAAMVCTMLVVAGDYLHYSKEIVSATAIVVCFGLRFLGLHFHWNLPSFRDKKNKRMNKPCSYCRISSFSNISSVSGSL